MHAVRGEHYLWKVDRHKHEHHPKRHQGAGAKGAQGCRPIHEAGDGEYRRYWHESDERLSSWFSRNLKHQRQHHRHGGDGQEKGGDAELGATHGSL
jgi:hypothetical protein